jgi:hypothetical protein
MKEDERNLRLAVDIAMEKESNVNSYSSQEILNIQVLIFSSEIYLGRC